LKIAYEESPRPNTVKFTFLRELEGKSARSKNFHVLSIVCGGSPSPVVATMKIKIGVTGSKLMSYSSHSQIYGLSFLLVASLPSSSAADLAVFVCVP